MRTISTGQPSTLKTYRDLAKMLFPKAVKMLDEKIEVEGEDSEVIASETQMLQVLAAIEFDLGKEKK